MDTISQSERDDSDDSDDNNNCPGHIQCSAGSFASVSVDLTDDPALKHETKAAKINDRRRMLAMSP
jgi:hypothetical protein